MTKQNDFDPLDQRGVLWRLRRLDEQHHVLTNVGNIVAYEVATEENPAVRPYPRTSTVHVRPGESITIQIGRSSGKPPQSIAVDWQEEEDGEGSRLLGWSQDVALSAEEDRER